MKSLYRTYPARTVCLTLILFPAAGASLARAQDACKVVLDAGDKLTATPHHGYQTRAAAGQSPRSSEDISVNGAIYVKMNGQWKKSPLTVKQRQQQEQENRKDAQNTSCHYVRDEAVNGEAASVYSAHAETEGLKSDSLVWISKSKGLVLRQEEDLDMDGEKSHVSAHFQYGGVTAPAIAP
jgi:hypothetical protein